MLIVIIGDSGHAKVIADCIHSNPEHEIIAKLDDKYNVVFEDEGLIKGPIEHLHTLLQQTQCKVIVGIGSNRIRQKIVERLNLSADTFATIIHQHAIVSPLATLASGTVIMPGAVVNVDAIIGRHCIINTNSVIEHDCIVGDFAHISPNSTLTGGVCFGKGSHLGATATVIPMQKVGDWSIIGAGSVIISEINSNVTAVGIPAKVIKREGL
ncbi:acetyltransferase [Viridibacillus sp. YIM B01967]|uniref:Acetyltransferase n=1 Tax=Viridibacillus soli TaxID=2798301 RepID=A0ABS1HCI6_9BACL|nr:acetyltransferase [Viridibacillus soli]MBK3497119.1 acetyltransferase [Viridibacillus soli]